VIDKNSQIKLSDSTSVLREEVLTSVLCEENSNKKKFIDNNKDEEEPPEDEMMFNNTSFKIYDKLFD